MTETELTQLSRLEFISILLREDFLSHETGGLNEDADEEKQRETPAGRIWEDPNFEPIFSFPVFTDEFCSEFMEEIQKFESLDLPKSRPNSMNR